MSVDVIVCVVIYIYIVWVCFLFSLSPENHAFQLSFERDRTPNYYSRRSVT
jgi:hypothetical protein